MNHPPEDARSVSEYGVEIETKLNVLNEKLSVTLARLNAASGPHEQEHVPHNESVRPTLARILDKAEQANVIADCIADAVGARANSNPQGRLRTLQEAMSESSFMEPIQMMNKPQGQCQKATSLEERVAALERHAYPTGI